LGSTGTRAEWVALDGISSRLVQATLAAEDRRFWHHPGIDPLALLRAAASDARAGRIVSGGSTITQQLAGMLWPEPRTVAGKLRETVRALRLEGDLSKRAILEQYLNRLPYAPGASGIAAASRALLQREPATLSASQAATLAALPQAPARFARPAGHDALRSGAIASSMPWCAAVI
jgi:penicillin-binding protein 1C